MNKNLFNEVIPEKAKKAPAYKKEAEQKKEYKPAVYIGQNIYIKPNYLVSIPEYYRENKTVSLKSIQNQANLLNNDHNGKLSRKAVQALRNSINWLCLAAKKKTVYNKTENKTFYFKINFITLTLPDTEKPILSNELQKNLLNPFLTYMRKYHGLKNYVWRLEFQANGKLHVHITTDSFLHLNIIKDTWNRLLDNNKYLEQFYKKNGHKNPNSTDVHSVKKIKNIAAYLAKYMSKKNKPYIFKDKLIFDTIRQMEKQSISPEVIKKTKHRLENIKPYKLTVMNYKTWYFHRLNFWNSNFNPRPITGRIWSCSTELSKASKAVVHISTDELSKDLRCLQNPEIEYNEILSYPKEINKFRLPDDPVNLPRKIGELYFLKASDWFTKINGAIRKKFEEIRANIANLTTNYSFELYT